MRRATRLLPLLALLVPGVASAHEVYVLTSDQWRSDMAQPTVNLLAALRNPADLSLTLKICLGITLALLAGILFRQTAAARQGDKALQRFAPYGLLVVRLTLAASLFFSAATHSAFGPELPLHALPFGDGLVLLLYLLGALFLLGLFVQPAALVALGVYALVAKEYGWYSLTYLNYLGEILALLAFGSPVLSLDRRLGFRLPTAKALALYEPALLRVLFGAALLYTAIQVKVIHDALTLQVIHQYGLTRFHYLFPSDPLLTALGAALAEIMIALCFMLGFQTRPVALVFVFYVTLSLLFFREAVWPHLMLYGLAVGLFISDGGPLTLDRWLDRRVAGLLGRKRSRRAA